MNEIKQTVARRYRFLTGEAPPPVSIRFYPYRNLTNTVRLRRGTLCFRLSDVLEDLPPAIQQAAAEILTYKICDKPPPVRLKQFYRNYIARTEVRDRVRSIRRQRGQKRMTGPAGKVFDLQELFTGLNQRYFQSRLEISRLGWSQRAGRRSLGHYDAAHDSIVVNRRLDNPLVPRYVVAYVLYHEMLHAHLGEDTRRSKRIVHHREFREKERKFADYRRARRFIDRWIG